MSQAERKEFLEREAQNRRERRQREHLAAEGTPEQDFAKKRKSLENF